MLLGIKGLLNSRKAMFCLIILATTTYGAHVGAIDGTSYSAVVGVLATIYNLSNNASKKITREK